MVDLYDPLINFLSLFYELNRRVTDNESWISVRVQPAIVAILASAEAQHTPITRFQNVCKSIDCSRRGGAMQADGCPCRRHATPDRIVTDIGAQAQGLESIFHGWDCLWLPFAPRLPLAPCAGATEQRVARDEDKEKREQIIDGLNKKLRCEILFLCSMEFRVYGKKDLRHDAQICINADEVSKTCM